MSTYDSGRCDPCGQPLSRRFWRLERKVERWDYGPAEGDQHHGTSITTLSAETIGLYCSEECARRAALEALRCRGLTHLYPGPGPVEPCARCGNLVDLARPHVAYILLVGTETHKPWLTVYAPEFSEALAVVCNRCDGDLAMDQLNVEADELRKAATRGGQPVSIGRQYAKSGVPVPILVPEPRTRS